MDNKMAEVAKLLGVELDEVFFFKGRSGCYTYYPKTYLKFTESGLKESADRTSWHSAAAWVWKGLITGEHLKLLSFLGGPLVVMLITCRPLQVLANT